MLAVRSLLLRHLLYIPASMFLMRILGISTYIIPSDPPSPRSISRLFKRPEGIHGIFSLRQDIILSSVYTSDEQTFDSDIHLRPGCVGGRCRYMPQYGLHQLPSPWSRIIQPFEHKQTRRSSIPRVMMPKTAPSTVRGSCYKPRELGRMSLLRLLCCCRRP